MKWNVVELTDIESGVYIITILSEGETVFTEKILNLTSLVSGTYVYEVRDQGVVIGGGKVFKV